MTPKQEKLLKLITAFDTACRENGVKYSLACGSALGAVREKSFIQWDEDLDIMMTIDDYEKMEKHHIDYCGAFKWVACQSVVDSPVIFARIYEKEVDFNSLENYPYIDIHIYVRSAGNSSATKKAINLTDTLIKIYWVKKRKYHHIFKRKKSLLGFICKILFLFVPCDFCVKIVNQYRHKWDACGSNFMMPLQGYYKMKEVIPEEYLLHYKDVDFSGKRLMLIEKYDQYLRQLYGDYMIPVRYNH